MRWIRKLAQQSAATLSTCIDNMRESFFFFWEVTTQALGLHKDQRVERREAKFGPAEESPVSAQEGQGENKGG